MDNQNSKKNSYANKIVAVKSIVLGLVSLITFSNYYFAGGQECQEAMEKYVANETEALKFFDQLGRESSGKLLESLKKVSIPKSRENIKIVEEIEKNKSMSPHLVKRNNLVRSYTEKRLRVYELYKKTLIEDTNEYSNEIDKLIDETENLRKEIEDIKV